MERRKAEDRMPEDEFRKLTLETFRSIQLSIVNLHENLEHRLDSLRSNVDENTALTKANSILASRAVGLAEEAVALSSKSLAAASESAATAKDALALAKKNAEDTSGWVAISGFTGKSAEIVGTTTKRVSKAAKILWPIIIIVSFFTAWHQGYPMKISEIIAVLSK